MHPWLMALTIGAMPLGAVMLYFSITRIVRLLRESEVARLPAANEGTVTFDAPGTYVLHIEQPRLNTAMFRANFSMRDAVTGADVRSSPVIFRTTNSGFSTASVSVCYFEVERVGAYRLLVTGIGPASDVSRIQLIFTRPYATPLFLLILGTVLGGACLIGGFVLTALQYYGEL